MLQLGGSSGMTNNQKRCNVMINGEYIQEIYGWYENNILAVNRKYQRKLVWTLDEKRQFIDTIMKGYPVPLFLIYNNQNSKTDKVNQKEIIDGLQRLESIIAFINNEYYINYNDKNGYFNLDVLPGKGQLIRDGKLVQKQPILDFELCRTFIGYQLPVSTIETNESEEVENIFKRINSTGRKLSLQNLRQAGVSGLFYDLVYKTAAKIRGDYTEENIINLIDMSKYSINSRGLNYGIKVQDIFWIKQGIITEDGIRRSKDEEIIANLYNCILNNYKTSMSRQVLDTLYNETSSLFKKNEEKLFGGRDNELMSLFLLVFDDFKNIFKQNNSSFSNLLFEESKNCNKDLVFIIVFLAMFQLRSEFFIIEDYAKMSQAMNNIANRELNEIISKSECTWNMEIRNSLIERVKNKLKKAMTFKQVIPEWSQEIIDLLKRAEVEEQMYDFKIGITSLYDGKLNPDVIPKCIKTLTAMANTHIGKEGVIIIGVSDKESDAQDFKNHYGVEPPKYNNYYVTGIKEEAIKYYGSVEKYLNKIISLIQNENKNIDSVAMNYILSNVKVIKYNEQTLIVLKLKSDKSLFYKQELYVRHQSNNKKINLGSPEFYNVFKN